MGQGLDWNPARGLPRAQRCLQESTCARMERTHAGNDQGIRVAPGWGPGQPTQDVQGSPSGLEGS